MSNKLVKVLVPVVIYEYEIVDNRGWPNYGKEVIQCNLEGGVSIDIEKSLFELFLLTNEKLDWELNYSEAGEHIQKTGSMTYEEYWEQDMPYIYQDLSEYITRQLIDNQKTNQI